MVNDCPKLLMDSLDLIGKTPMVKVNRIDTGVCDLYLKMESLNPGGSIKDRIGLSMIIDAEEKGYLKPGGTIVEATAGNTGIGLALVAAVKGYELILVIPDKMSQEKVQHLRAMGTKIIITRSDVNKGHPAYYQDLAKKIAQETPNAYYINQFENSANPKAHYTTTGPEIAEQLQGKVDAIVVGVGSSGTVTGLSKYFKAHYPATEIILADPKGSIMADFINKGKFDQAGSWVVEGIGEDFVPDIGDFSAVSEAITVDDETSLNTARELLRKEGLLGGSSSGTLLAAAIAYCKAQTSPKNVVTFVCDTGNKYLSKMYNDFWMKDRGFIRQEQFGDLRDLLSRRYDLGEVVTLKKEDTVDMALNNMKLYEISQLPIMDQDKIIGIVDESDLLVALNDQQLNFNHPVSNCMTSDLKLINKEASLSELQSLLKQGLTAILIDQGKFLGLITPIDLLNYMRKTLK
ncbi:cystathionine beta-synthase (plasmid) [Persicobacter psychrovividus]|uniref:Cystathionine beta-synthase n=2 Tax=Persicobacter psychrovividus TaxID=387638 RepID=A0ABM7VLD9_9BACT|nr:cystathionine beta-synthase [Persicobacter psychrovividus]